jgi:rhamnose transport system ATP-binding protein
LEGVRLNMEAEAMPRLRVEHLSKSFEAVQALRDVTFDLAPGEIHALVGENGAGKSTLVGVITGLLRPDAGGVRLDGEAVEFRSPQEARQAGVAAVYQDPHLFPHLSVAENIFTGQYPTRRGLVDRARMRSEASALLTRLGFEIDVDAVVAGLTVAESQFVEIARALSADLRLLILDEPTSALTPSEAERLFDVVRGLKQQGTTIVWISHRMEEVRLLADTITVLRDGGHVRTAPAADLDDDTMIRLMVGRSVVLDAVPRTEPLGASRLSVRGLSVPGVFDKVGFDVHEGEIVGVAGLVGSGRSEIAQSIFGLGPTPTGEVRIDGRAVRPRSPRQMAELGVVYIPENRDAEGVLASMSITDNVVLPSIRRRAQHQGAHRRPGQLAVRGQPAEGRPGALAGHEPEGAAPRRADPRHRCRNQSPGARDDAPAREVGAAGDPHDLVRPAGGPRGQRPRARHLQRTPRR